MRHAHNAAPLPQRLVKGLTQYNGYILNGVVLINVKIAFCFQHYVKSAMAADMVNQMIQHADSSAYLVLTCAVDIQAKTYLYLFGIPDDFSRSFSH
jgi:hypothetical protein